MHSSGIASTILPFHILAGGLALVFGYDALYATKGATVHRRSGLGFVYAMVTMGLTGAVVAALPPQPSLVSVVAGLLTFYLVTTAVLAVRPRPEDRRRIDAAAMLFAAVLAVFAFAAGVALMGTRRPEMAPSFIFGVVAALAANGDRRALRAPLLASRRIVRHLWRMCFAMWVAAASFFWGPPGRVPEIIRIPPLLAIAVLTPVAVMVYWLWRLRTRNGARAVTARASRGSVLAASHASASRSL
jgi:uncharacterized membrane protein